MLQKQKEKVIKWGRELRAKRAACHERNWKNTYRPVYLTAVFLFAFLSGIGGAQFFRQKILAFLLGAFIGFFIASLVLKTLSVLVSACLKSGVKNFVCCAFILSLTVVLCAVGTPGGSGVWSVASGVIFGSLFIIFGKSLWAFFHNRVHTRVVAFSAILSGIPLLLAGLLFCGVGFKDESALNCLSLERTGRQPVEGFEAELKNGRYTALCLEYGPSEAYDLKSKTVDLSYAVSNAGGIEGVWRGLVSDYDVSEAAVAGKVWYPKESADCPVLFLVHGNHSILTDSYLGYDYLGEYLASHGYVFVSIDENVLNGLSGENDARAILLLENIKQALAYSGENGGPLSGKIDERRIAIAGHSRGGEAVATAFLFNGYSRYPENGRYRFDYHFPIRSVIAIAPTVDQYMPADHQVELCDVNYLLLHGANDQDVNTFMGNVQYENIEFKEKEKYIKTSLYISDANHGQFNTLWGEYDLPSPLAWFLNTENFISMEEQQTILKVFAKVFLDKTLKGIEKYETLLTDCGRYGEYLPDTVYIQQYEKSGTHMLCNYEEDSDLLTGTDPNVHLQARNMYLWTEEMLRFSGESGDEKNNYALRLIWSGTKEASYSVTFQEPAMIKNGRIAFDICDMDIEAAKEGAGEKLEPELRIRDTDGNEANLSVSDYAAIYPPLPVKLGKIQCLTGQSEYKRQHQTVSIPADLFISSDKEVDLEHISKIEILFPNNSSGNVSIDNVCIQRDEQ